MKKAGEGAVGAKAKGRSKFGSVTSEMPITYPDGDVKVIVEYVGHRRNPGWIVKFVDQSIGGI